MVSIWYGDMALLSLQTERTQWFDEDATNAASAANATVAASTTAVAATTYDVTDAQPMGEGWWNPVG